MCVGCRVGIASRAGHNSYGFVGCGFYKSKHLQRTDYICGYHHKEGFSNCGDLWHCIENFMDGEFSGLYEFDLCLEQNVHGALHDMHAGMWDCHMDLTEFKEQHSWISEGLLSFLAVAHVNCINYFAYWDALDCDETCDLDVPAADCGCRMSAEYKSKIPDLLAIDNMERKEVYSYTQECKTIFNEKLYRGKNYLEVTDSGEIEWKNMTTHQQEVLDKLLLKLSLFPGKWGFFMTAAASNDPLFWVMHQNFDRVMHLLRVSEAYRGNVNFSWTPIHHAGGTGWLSHTPFNGLIFEPFLGSSDVLLNSEGEPRLLTNKELWALLKPSSKSIPYVYDSIRDYGSCEFPI